MDTTRRFPRSMAEAFPDARASWFEYYPRRESRAIVVIIAIAITLIAMGLTA